MPVVAKGICERASVIAAAPLPDPLFSDGFEAP
jgi:hypothetical protein